MHPLYLVEGRLQFSASKNKVIEYQQMKVYSTRKTNSRLFIPLSTILRVMRPEVADKYPNRRVILISKEHTFSRESDDQEHTTVRTLVREKRLCTPVSNRMRLCRSNCSFILQRYSRARQCKCTCT